MVRWREPQCKRISQYYLILCVYAFQDSIKKNSTQASRTELVVELRLRRISFVISEKNRKINSAFSPCSFPFGQQYICVVLVIKHLFSFCNAAINYFSSVFCFFFNSMLLTDSKCKLSFCLILDISKLSEQSHVTSNTHKYYRTPFLI